MIVRKFDVVWTGIDLNITVPYVTLGLSGTIVPSLATDRHPVAGMIYPSAIDFEALAELVRSCDVELVAVVVTVPVPSVAEFREETLRP